MAYEPHHLTYGDADPESHVGTRTMVIQHTKHHQALLINVNAALEGHPDLAAWPVADLIARLDAVPETIRTAV